jgi:hypothetical protein
MAVGFKRQLLNSANKILNRAGFELIKKGREFQDYIPFKYTLQEAEKAGLSLSDYIDNNYNVPGTTQLTIDKMNELGVFNHEIHRICEIGPGSGRYLEKVKTICDPEYYEIYETSRSWKEWLVEKYNVTAQPTDGASLASTPSKSIDLVHTHKVLYGNSILTIFRYFMEMARVTKDGGFLVFDLLTAECMNNEILNKWVESGVDHAHSMTPRSVALDYFSGQGFRHCGSFIVPMAPGVTEYFVFKKEL